MTTDTRYYASDGFGIFATMMGVLFVVGGALLVAFGDETLSLTAPLAVFVAGLYLARHAEWPSPWPRLQRIFHLRAAAHR